MILTKNQSKQLRYICGTVPYNQPCTKKYTGGPDGKVREIGKILYAEKNGELVYFEYEGKAVDLSVCDTDAFLREVANGYLPFKKENTTKGIADGSGSHLGGAIDVEGLPSADTNGHNDIVDATTATIAHLTVGGQLKNEVHEVNVPVEVQPASDGWMNDDGNDPAGIGASMADVPVYLTEEDKKAAENEGDPEGNNKAPFTETPATITAIELTEDALREISMTAAAMEASRLCGVISGNYGDTSVDIIRRNATVPNFLNVYGECLHKVGNAYSLDEIAAALPAQRTWILNNGVSVK